MPVGIGGVVLEGGKHQAAKATARGFSLFKQLMLHGVEEEILHQVLGLFVAEAAPCEVGQHWLAIELVERAEHFAFGGFITVLQPRQL